MGDIYRVTIVRESGDGEGFESETVFEIAGPARRVRQAAPGVLADILDEATNSTTASPASATAASIFDNAVQQGVAAGALPAAPIEPPKRKRRTKEQIAADEAAAAQPQAASLVTQPHDAAAGSVPVIGQPEQAAAPEQAAPAAAPYNPFAVA